MVDGYPSDGSNDSATPDDPVVAAICGHLALKHRAANQDALTNRDSRLREIFPAGIPLGDLLRSRNFVARFNALRHVRGLDALRSDNPAERKKALLHLKGGHSFHPRASLLDDLAE